MFRSFWERDECHSLLEKLRVEAEQEEAMLEAAGATTTGSEDTRHPDSWDGEVKTIWHEVGYMFGREVEVIGGGERGYGVLSQ